MIEEEMDDKEEIQNLKNGKNTKVGDKIYVNDYGECKIVESSDVEANLVIEEDGSVRWYVNPDHRSDVWVKTVYVILLVGV